FDELAGHNESIAAVVAFAAENADALRLRVIGEDETSDGRAGVLHQRKRRNAEALRGGAIDLAHFRRADDFHRVRPCRDLVQRKYPPQRIAKHMAPSATTADMMDARRLRLGSCL